MGGKYILEQNNKTMARHREAPRCPFFNKVIAKPKYSDQSNLPIQLQLIGDTFIGWEYEKHACKEREIYSGG